MPEGQATRGGARALAIGLDGADWSVVEALGPARMPTLFRLRERGAWSRLKSVTPPATLPNWSTFLTGLDPGEHGVFDFTVREGYRVLFAGGTVRAAPTIAARLDRMGLKAACVGFPGTWPPEKLERGIFLSGWDSPVAFEADASHLWPPSLHEEIRARFGPLRFDEVDELAADSPGWHARLPDALIRRIEEKSRLARWLIGRERWDLFLFYFGESDTAAHHLWALHDPASPRHPFRTSKAAREGLGRVYEALDRAVAELWEAAGGEEVELTLLSDHGSGGASDKVLYLNRALEAAGLLCFSARSPLSGLASGAKDRLLPLLPAALRERLFSAAGRLLPGWIESRARFGGIDMARTRAFSDELNYFPAIHLNLEGREPKGVVRPADREATIAEVEAALKQLCDPWTKRPILRALHRRESLYRGPYLERAPDLLLELELDERGYSYNLMPTGGAPPGTGPWRRLGPEEHLGRKGRSLPGSHRARGLFLAHGPRIRPVGEIEAGMADVTRNLLARLDIEAEGELRGRRLPEILRRARGPASSASPRELAALSAEESRELRGDGAVLERRLRALGYID